MLLRKEVTHATDLDLLTAIIGKGDIPESVERMS